MKDYQIQNSNILIIPDIHQDLDFADHAIKNEEGNFDYIIFLGDYFDTHKKDDSVYPVKDVCFWLLQKQKDYGERAKFIIGNHDLQYYEYSLHFNSDRTRNHANRLFYACGGITNNKCKIIAKNLDLSFWRSCRMFYVCNNYLLSHAGLHESFWFPDNLYSTEECLDKVNRRCEFALLEMKFNHDQILDAGEVRGGQKGTIGGINWLDWYEEFNDSLPIPQIVGHSCGSTPRTNGKSFCIDCDQKYYGLLNKNGLFEIKDKEGNVW